MSRTPSSLQESVRDRFGAFIDGVSRKGSFVVLCHNDVDGLAAGVILTKALRGAGWEGVVQSTGKGENPWSPEVLERASLFCPGCLLVADFAPRPAALLPGVPTLVLDHHRPEGVPPEAVLISAYGHDPTPTSGLLAYWASQHFDRSSSLRWIAALSLLGDLGDKAPFPELAEEKEIHGLSLLREVTSLLNAPRRSASGDGRPALDLLLQVGSPAEILDAAHPGTDLLRAARAEVQAELSRAKMAAPTFSGQVALVQIHSPCQVHPLIAQIWKQRLQKYIVISANTGYRTGFVHFSVRSAASVNLLDFLKQAAPPEVGEAYGGGHDQATGGALPVTVWKQFIKRLGFEEQSAAV